MNRKNKNKNEILPFAALKLKTLKIRPPFLLEMCWIKIWKCISKNLKS